MRFEDLKNDLGNAWESVAVGWRNLVESASNALTQFKPNPKDGVPEIKDVDDAFYFPSSRWSMLAGNVFEDENRIVVHIEIPGMDKDSMHIDINEDALVVKGEKRFEKENSDGRYRAFQCAYGYFQRAISLPSPVIVDKAKATYRDGVLRIDMPKKTAGKPLATRLKVE